MNIRYIFKAKGKAKYVFQWFSLWATTRPIESDFYWWYVRGQIIALDQDKMPSIPVEERFN